MLTALKYAGLWGADALVRREKELAIELGDEKLWWQKSA